jgi:hypothetical protein
MTIDFSGKLENPVPRVSGEGVGASIPFAVLPDRNHSTITKPAENPGSQPATANRLGELILRALRCDTAGIYATIAGEWSTYFGCHRRSRRQRCDSARHVPAGSARPSHLPSIFSTLSHAWSMTTDARSTTTPSNSLAAGTGRRRCRLLPQERAEDVHVNGQAKNFAPLRRPK